MAQLCLTGRQPGSSKESGKDGAYGLRRKIDRMIDYFALALGHGLLAIAFLRLVQRDELDVDPVIEAANKRARKEAKARHTRTHAGDDEA